MDTEDDFIQPVSLNQVYVDDLAVAVIVVGLMVIVVGEFLKT